jgi:hypothetical protein
VSQGGMYFPLIYKIPDLKEALFQLVTVGKNNMLHIFLEKMWQIICAWFYFR